ncbi:MAG TPA: DEAD/DEAH box helicase [Accumulibacter sp.]|jgi:ATP-dependent RNA helicase RhlE|nr:DEAD/DEAH box helicase [Accumulibacter sp.]HQC81608.1 DEAD/DEAH box helicase [Accumulibacter sp.]
MRFDQLGLAPELLKALAEKGYLEPTPIQARAIPLVLAGQDLMGGAQTGTGKTAAFTLPLLQRILPFASPSPSPARHPVRVLMLAPTRELAIQVHESVKTYSKYVPLRSCCAFGGVDIKPQIAEIRCGVEVLVATPGRLLDLVEQKCLNFGSVQALVLDEADRMLDMGFVPDVTRIINMLPKQRQSLLFSATFSEEIKKLADTMLRHPVLIEVARRNTVSETITHRVHPVAADAKRALLVKLLKSAEFNQVLVFTRTKLETNKLARELQRAGIAADSIHGDKTQQDRLKALEAFKDGSTLVLVATDVAARGLDIDELPHVINFELPRTPEDYIHRIGRTGRAGKPGTAISLVSASEVAYLAEIEKLIRIQVEQVVVPGYEPEYDYTYPPGDKHGHRRRPPLSPPPALAAPHDDRSSGRGDKSGGGKSGGRARASHIAADGFDFSKPYECAEPPPIAALDGDDKTSARHEHPHKPRRQVAALLGGLGRK